MDSAALAVGFEKYEARGLRGVDRARVDNSALATATAGSAWDEYSTLPAVTNEKRGFDEVTIASLATDADVNLDALDTLFSELRAIVSSVTGGWLGSRLCEPPAALGARLRLDPSHPS